MALCCCCCSKPEGYELKVLSLSDNSPRHHSRPMQCANEKCTRMRSKWGWKPQLSTQSRTLSIPESDETLQVYETLESLFVCEGSETHSLTEESEEFKVADEVEIIPEDPVPNSPPRPPAPRHRSTRFSVNSAPSLIRNLTSFEDRASIGKYSESHTEILGVHTLTSRPDAYLREKTSESSSTTQLSASSVSEETEKDLTARFNIVLDSPKTYEPRPQVHLNERIDLVPWLPGHENLNRWSMSPAGSNPLDPKEDAAAFIQESLHEAILENRATNWSQHVLSNQDYASNDLCFMLMHDSEERVPKKAYFQRFIGWIAHDEEMKPFENNESRGCFWRRQCLVQRDESGLATNVEMKRLRTQGKYVLGDSRWLKLERGYKIWTTFGMVQYSLNKFEMHMLYMDENTACLKLARLPATKGKALRSFNQRRNNGPVWEKRSTLKSMKSFSSKQPGKSSSEIMPRGAGRTFPLEALYEIDRTRELQATVLTKAIREQGFIAAAAMWSQNAPEPLICASSNASDIDDLILIIRFLQFYNGMNPASIIES